MKKLNFTIFIFLIFLLRKASNEEKKKREAPSIFLILIYLNEGEKSKEEMTECYQLRYYRTTQRAADSQYRRTWAPSRNQ